MRLALAVAALAGGVAHADPPALVLDGTPGAAEMLDDCVRDGHVKQDDRDDELRCKVLATKTIAGQRVRVIATSESMEDAAFVELATKGGLLYLRDTTMHYTPGMGERGSPVQTLRDWTRPPAIEPGTLADGTPAVVIRIPWTSHDVDRASGTSLGSVEAHAVILACALGPSPTCSSKLDLVCPADGCATQLAHGVLAVVTAGGTQRRSVTR